MSMNPLLRHKYAILLAALIGAALVESFSHGQVKFTANYIWTYCARSKNISPEDVRQRHYQAATGES
jgi:hypothetical protein